MPLLPGWLGVALALSVTGLLSFAAQRLARPLAAIVSQVCTATPGDRLIQPSS